MKAGRMTVAVTFIIVGLTVLFDQWKGTSVFIQLLPWWPVVLIAFGAEIMLLYRGNGKKIDIGGMILLVIVVGMTTAFAGAHALGVDISFEDGFNVQIGEFHGEPRPLAPMTFPLQSRELIVVENLNGNITVSAYEGNEIVVQPTLSLPNDRADQEEKIRKKISFEVSETDKEIRVGIDWREKQMNFLSLFQKRYSVHLDVKVPSSLSTHLETLNGKITVKDVKEDVHAEVANGSIKVDNIGKNVVAEAANGTIAITDVDGSVTAETANGKINIENVAGTIDAESAAGSIEIKSSRLGGDWHAETAAGSIEVSLPETADAHLDVSNDFGRVTSDYILNGDKDNRTGTLGSGTYNVRLETSAGQIKIHQLTMP